MPEREPQVPPIVQFAESTKMFASEKAEESMQFKTAASHIAEKLGGSQNPEARESAEGLIKQGISMVTQKVGLLPAFTNPEKRPEILEQLKKDKVEGAWIDVLANWDVKSDPYGVGVLKKCRALDLEEINSKTKDAKTPEQEEQIKVQAEAIGRGQDLIISFYESQTGQTGLAQAA